METMYIFLPFDKENVHIEPRRPCNFSLDSSVSGASAQSNDSNSAKPQIVLSNSTRVV
jgi:hypothetical protein